MVIEAAGIGWKVAITPRDSARLAACGEQATIFCITAVKKDGIELYGFADEHDLAMCELVMTVNGVGPKTAQGIVGVVGAKTLLAAVQQKKSDILAEFPGIGKKKAERIVLELYDKIKKMDHETLELHEGDRDIKGALKQLGYQSREIEAALKTVPNEVRGTEARLKAALKAIGKHAA